MQTSPRILLVLLFPALSLHGQDSLDLFLQNQPVIDVHIHITKGYTDNPDYNILDPDIDRAKVEWLRDELDRNNVVLALGGGPLAHALRWPRWDERYWSGPLFPCNELVEQDAPCPEEMPDSALLDSLYRNGTLKYLGETSFHSMGIPPTEDRFDAYWALAEKYEVPVGFHADAGPFKRNMEETPNWNEAYGNPLLLLPILKKFPKLKIYLMHYPGRYFEECIQLMQQYDQIYCDISAVSMFAPKEHWEPKVKKLYAEGLGDRLLFGSDYVGSIRQNLQIIYDLDWLTDRQKRDVYYNNAARFLGLSEEVIRAHRLRVQQR